MSTALLLYVLLPQKCAPRHTVPDGLRERVPISAADRHLGAAKIDAGEEGPAGGGIHQFGPGGCTGLEVHRIFCPPHDGPSGLLLN